MNTLTVNNGLHHSEVFKTKIGVVTKVEAYIFAFKLHQTTLFISISTNIIYK
jgi:hypothetical protein